MGAHPTRLEQDAADALVSHEQRAKWREQVLADLARMSDNPVTGVWSPTLTEQQKAEFEQYSKEWNLPF